MEKPLEAVAIEVFEKEPFGFSPQVHIAACYLEIEGL
jgi:hypothetical protein